MGFLRVLGAISSHSSDLVHRGKSFQARSIHVDQFQWSYYKRPAANPSSREIVVFLHGLGSQKEAWVRVASGLSKDYYVVIPDLPGHGKTMPLDPRMNFSAVRQVRRLHEFLESELYPNNKIHLIGTCMGATIAGVYAAMYPTRVKSLTLMCSWGLSTPVMGVTFDDIDSLTKLRPQSPTETLMSEFGEWHDRVASVANMVNTSRVFRAPVVSRRERAREVMRKVLLDMHAHPTILKDELQNIRARSLVIWGDQDEILDVACLKAFDKLKVSRKTVLMLEQCGHFIPHEKPVECVDVLNEFLADKDLSSNAAFTRF